MGDVFEAGGSTDCGDIKLAQQAGSADETGSGRGRRERFTAESLSVLLSAHIGLAEIKSVQYREWRDQ